MFITIDGRSCEYKPGDTILDAARRSGIDVPSLCHDPAIGSRGSCKLCVVEVDGQDSPVLSCQTPASSELTVSTESERLTRARRLILELLLSDHPVECGDCNQSGRCELEALAHRYRVRASRFSGVHHAVTARAVENPFIVRDPAKCILCGLCVEACDQLEGVGALRVGGWGFGAHVEPTGEACRSCGRCVSVCPAGALTERKRRGVGRRADVRKVASVCPHCGVGCELEINVVGENIAGITSPGGYLCVRGRYAYDFVHSPDRLVAPLARRGHGLLGGQLRQVSWDTALEYVSEGLKRVIDRHGPGAVAVLCSCRTTNEANYALQRFARAALGTNNIYNGAGEMPEAPTQALELGVALSDTPFEDFECASVILLAGSDPEQTHPVLSARLKLAARKGTRLIVVDPRRIDLASHADTYLRVRVGSEATLINALIKVIIDEDLFDKSFVEAHTEGFRELAKSVEAMKLEDVEEQTGVGLEEIERVAREIASAEKALFVYTSGAPHPMCGHEVAEAQRNLALLTGNAGLVGAGLRALRLQNNAQGVCDMGGLPDVLPGYQPVTDAEARAKFEAAWGAKLPNPPGVERAALVDAMLAGQVRALYVMGENPALSFPDPGRARLALESLEFLAVQDIFPTETTEMADAVLPAASWAEVEGTYTNTERRVQRVRAAVPSPGDVPPDWKIVCWLADRMGYRMAYSSAREIWDEAASLCPLFAGITYERLEAGGIQWPCTGCVAKERDLARENDAREEFRPRTPPGSLFGADLSEEYPLLLTTGKRLYHYEPGTTAQRAEGLDDLWPEDVLEVSPADAQKHHVRDGRRIRVVSRYGETVATVRVSDRTAEGVVFLLPHPRRAGTHERGPRGMDGLAASAEYGACAVRIESLEAAVIGGHGV